MLRSIRYELNPNNTQKEKFNQAFGNCRFVYNWALNKNVEAYKKDGTKLSAYEIMKDLTKLKNEEDKQWLKISGSQQLQQSITLMEKALINFFKGNANFPKFKSKNSRQVLILPQKVKVKFEECKFFVPRVGWIKYYKDKVINGFIKRAIVSKSATGRYYVSIVYETPEKQKFGEGVVGIDLGIKNFAISSEGEVFENQKYLKQNLKKLRIEKRKLQRKFRPGQEQSNNWRKQKLIVSKLHEKISNQRRDYLHKLSTHLTETYETICVEDLNVKGMIRNRHLSREISDAGWGMFKRMLEYKAKDLRVINRFEPTSKTCNICGWKNNDLQLHQRTWTCENGHKLDRDINAALNIKEIGLRASTFTANVSH